MILLEIGLMVIETVFSELVVEIGRAIVETLRDDRGAPRVGSSRPEFGFLPPGLIR